MPQIAATPPTSLTSLRLEPQSGETSNAQPLSPSRQSSDRIEPGACTGNTLQSVLLDDNDSMNPNPHIVAGNIAHWFNTFNAVALPVTVAADILRLKKAFAQDNEHIREHTVHAAAGIAAGLAGAYAGGSAGAQAGMLLGGEIGAVAGPGGAVIGAAIGSVSGSLLGSISAGLGAARLGEAIAEHVMIA
jgi:hypothetical protein